MSEIALYVTVSILLVGVTSYLLVKSYKKSHNTKYLFFLLLVAIVPFLPYMMVEAQTYFYKQELLPAIQSTLNLYEDSTTVITLKVLLVTPTHADVYVVVPCDTMPEHHPVKGYVAYILPLEKSAGGWTSTVDKTIMQDAVWSDCGSAEGNIFPPYAAKGDYT